jgi:type II secretory pathway pseudopilin PulG
VVPAFVALLSIASIVLLLRLRRRKQEQLDEVKLQQERSAAQIAQLQDRYGNVISVDEERARITGEIEVLGKQLATAKSNFQDSSAVLDKLKKTISLYQDDINMIEFGFYPKRYDFDISQRFKDAIESVRERQKEMLKSGGAFVCDKDWVVEGSRAEGQRMIKKYERLMLRAFNGEADSTIADVTWSNVSRVEARLDASFEAINKLGESYSCRVTRDYFKLKLDELRLTYEYKEKVRAEKEEQRRIQEQIREEERAQKEIERALKEAEDEEGRYRKALDRARSELLLAGGEEIEKQKRKIAELEQQLRDAHEKRERAISRAQLTKSGHVYIISNIGSFGENKFKIGMTRRLDPLDRVRELSDASVPFDFDVHAIIYTEDAPGFENRLHQHFSSQRVNKVNERKEFFDVSIDEIETAVRQMNAKIDIIKTPEARDYRQTLALVGRASS